MVSILTMAVYSSSINFVSAKPAITVWACTQLTATPNKADCTWHDKDGVATDYNCTYNTTTKKWSCVEVTAKIRSDRPTISGSNIPADLRNALDSARQKSQDGGLVTGQNNTQDSNSSASTTKNSPKISSQVPQTSTRQTPNTSFGN